ncbi:MAG: NAD-dependent deacylase [Cyanobacteriota bacterium]
MDNKILRAAEILAKSDRVVVSTGAGVSRESGIPTFRECQEGLWANFNPEELATVEGFLKDPPMVWNWYQSRIEKILDVEPNEGHYAIARMQDMFLEFHLITQNIDNLHKKAGSRNICELHGNIFEFKCFDEEILIDELPDTDEVPPRCPNCGAMIRPNVVWFGEQLPEHQISHAFRVAGSCDTMIVVGTSGMVQPAASLPYVAKRNSNTSIIEVNPNSSGITSIADVFLQGKSGEILPELLEKLEEIKNTKV